ncbi:hypothetical protein QBC45DRAFT_428152 [Copromyces sp. CBS 386.78]|nr:hypothetical protein QBC45DRAFT_428152 [Copromyces sp. CBS 386.78]
MADMLWFLWFTFCSSLAHPSHLHSFRPQPRRSWDAPRRDRISKQASPFLRTSMFWMAVDPRGRCDVQDLLGTQST